MQWLGSTPEERRQYKNDLLTAKRAAGAGFDIDKFNSAWLQDHEEGTQGRTPQAVEDRTESKAPVKKPIKELQAPQGINNSIQTEKPVTGQLERIQGDIIDAERGEDSAEDDAELREVVNEIQAAINTYKLAHDITDFSREKNGITRLAACFHEIGANVVKPSKVLKRKPYDSNNLLHGVKSNNNAYDADKLIKFVDICARLCAREGFGFNRLLYMNLTGTSADYIAGKADYLTSSGIGLREKILNTERAYSLNMAYGSDIGNMRNLNEGEAVIRSDRQAGRPYMSGAELRKLPG